MKKILFFLLIFSTFHFLTIGQAIAQTDEEKMTDLRSQIEVLEKQAEQYRDTIAQTQEQEKTLKSQITNLKNQISALQTQISLTGKKIDKTKIEINDVQNNIFTTQEKINKQKNTIGQLLLLMDRRDKESLLSIILKNNDLSDYFNQTQSATNVNMSLMDLVDDLQKTENNLNQNRVNLEDK